MATLYDFNSPPIKGSSWTFYITLVSQSDTDIFQTSVTLAAGDVKVSKDGAAFNNVATLPTEIGTSGVLSCPLSAAEMNANVVVVKFTDAAGTEWQDAMVEIRTMTDQLDGAGDSIAADTWAYASRTLTQSAASVTSAVTGSDINVTRGDTLIATLTGLGSTTGYVSLWFTVKSKQSDADAASIIQIRKNTGGTSDGLLVLNATTVADTTLGSITIGSGTTGPLTITIDESATDDLSAPNTYHYDVQMLRDNNVYTLTFADCIIGTDITRAIT